MFERFTPEARAVVMAARGKAVALSHRYIGTEHLLLGLLDEGLPEGAAKRVLVAAGIDPDHVRAEVLRLVGCGDAGSPLGESEAAALDAIGVDLESVRSKVEQSFGEGILDQPPAGLPAGRLPFTARAKKCLELALREARRLGRDSLTPEHILLGLIREGRGIAAQVIVTKAPLDTVRQRLLAELDPAA